MTALSWSNDISLGGLVLRPATPADAEDLAALMAEPDVEQWWHQAWTPGRWAEYIAGLVADDNTLPLSLVGGGAAVGYVEVYRVAADVLGDHIAHSPTDLGMHLALGESVRGAGTGTRLIRSILEHAGSILAGCDRLVAEPDARNLRSHRAFAAAGFAVVGTVRLPPDKTAVLMAAEPYQAGRKAGLAREDTYTQEGALL
jgi:RimJ/RimL family protein N-acetyltransferase